MSGVANSRPSLLFHYTSQLGLSGIALSKTVWASKVHYLNDGREFSLCVDLMREYIDVLLQRPGTSVDDRVFLRAMRDWGERVASINICVASFTEEGDLLSQWRGYCQPGNGFSFGVPFEVVEQSALTQGWTVAQCMYRRDEHLTAITALVDEYLQLVRRAQKGVDTPPVDEQGSAVRQVAYEFALALGRLAPSIKDSSFSEEKEWRVISQAVRYPDLEYRTGRHTLIPYANFALLGVEEAEVLVNVGPTQFPELSSEATGGLLRKRGFRKYTVLPSEIPFRDW